MHSCIRICIFIRYSGKNKIFNSKNLYDQNTIIRNVVIYVAATEVMDLIVLFDFLYFTIVSFRHKRSTIEVMFYSIVENDIIFQRKQAYF